MIYLNHICDPENNSSRWMKLNIRIFSKLQRGFPRAPLYVLYCFNFTLMIWSTVHQLHLFCLQMILVLVLVLHVQLN